MGFLHKLWDETLAGPAPDAGLGKLRKYNSFSARSTAAPTNDVVAPPNDDNHPIQVSRSITVLRSNAHRNLTVSIDSPSAPSSPCGSSAPSSPFSPNTPSGNFKKLTRRQLASASQKSSNAKSPNGYDWIVLSALDR
ncbi:hypothetical protein ACJIZ3_021104 [Penstemon smallii]|uniref:Uncharacterized protein n=1 Tax=Penstemon smallii TaxID=265156 RepID=A0ABD3SKT9_9LAMI